jgi:hypothetical protein
MSEERWRERYDKLAEDTLEVYGIVYGQLTDPERDMGADERIAAAANELHWAANRLEARGIFDSADL